MTKLKSIETVCGILDVYFPCTYTDIDFSTQKGESIAMYIIATGGITVVAHPHITGAQVDQLRLEIRAAIPGYLPLVAIAHEEDLQKRLKQIERELAGLSARNEKYRVELERSAIYLREELAALEG